MQPTCFKRLTAARRPATGVGTTHLGQQQMAAWRSVLARQLRELVLKILETQVDSEAFGVFPEDGAHHVHFVRQGRVQQSDG